MTDAIADAVIDAVTDTASGQQHLYGGLAPWWPLISPVAAYAEEAAFTASVLESASIPVHDVLELGSGGGHNAFYLSRRFAMTLVDLSAAMLTESRRLNPRCAHLCGDMRTVRLGRRFDAVLIHDAVDYMTTAADLQAAITTAFEHCRPGGIAVFIPDEIIETFAPSTDHDGADGADGRAVRYLTWSWDPDPTDTWIVTEYAFVLRARDGTTRVVHETHRTGLFSRAAWLQFLTAAGFVTELIPEQTTEARTPREFFVGHRPAG